MSLKKIDPTKTKSWDNLNSHYKTIKSTSIKDLFKVNPLRSDDFKIEWEDFYVDFSKNFCEEESVKKLFLNFDPAHLSESGHIFTEKLLLKYNKVQ